MMMPLFVTMSSLKPCCYTEKNYKTMILDRPSFYGDEFSKTPLMEVFKEVSRIYTNWEKRLPAAQFYPIYNAMALFENYHGKNKTRFQVKPVCLW